MVKDEIVQTNFIVSKIGRWTGCKRNTRYINRKQFYEISQ